MDTARYVLGVLMIVALPPAIVFWLLVHPFAGFWRRIGPGLTYPALAVICGLLGVLIYRLRGGMLGADLGTNRLLILLGVALYAGSAWISALAQRKLTLRAFVGLPELAPPRPGDGLLQEGIFGVVRHPRYLSVMIGVVGFALFVNYVGVYLVVLSSIPALFLVIFFEERELAARFGQAYELYRSRVPAMVPRFSRLSRSKDR